MKPYILPPPETGTITVNVETLPGEPTVYLFGLSGSGTGWSANGTELTLQPAASGGAYYVLSLALTGGYSFASNAAEIWGPDSQFGVVLTGDNPSIQLYDDLPAGTIQYLNVSAFINVTSDETMPFSFMINLLPGA